MKRKRLKEQPLSVIQLKGHYEALYSLCLKPIMKTSEAWVDAHLQIKSLADCLSRYKTYLDEQATKYAKNSKLDHPVRTVAEHCTVEHRKPAVLSVDNKFCILDASVIAAQYEPVFFRKTFTC